LRSGSPNAPPARIRCDSIRCVSPVN